MQPSPSSTTMLRSMRNASREGLTKLGDEMIIRGLRTGKARLIPELKWIAPFVCLAAIAGISGRAEPQAPPPDGAHVFVDIRGKEIRIGAPFGGAVLTRGTEVTGYLAATLAPETLLAVTAYGMGARVRNHTIGDIFPQVVMNRRIWASEGVSNAQGPKVEIERLLQYDPGAFMGWYTLAEPIERVGLAFIGFKPFPTSFDDLGYPDRAYSSAVGKPERGMALIDYEAKANAQTDADLRSQNALRHPRYLYLGAKTDGGFTMQLGAKNHYTRFFIPHAGVDNACACPNYYGLVDAEHIIADDPDIIVLSPTPKTELPDEFVNDPRWLGLTATLNRRVYRAPPGIDYYIAAPFWSRWLAELAHPEQMPRQSRQLYRDYIQWLFDYALSEDQLDAAFAVKDNHNMANAERFEAKRHEP